MPSASVAEPTVVQAWIEGPDLDRFWRIGLPLVTVGAAGATSAGIGPLTRAGQPAVRAESGLTISDDDSTASKSAPVRVPRVWRSSLSQRSSGAPLRYQGEPLSATMTP